MVPIPSQLRVNRSIPLGGGWSYTAPEEMLLRPSLSIPKGPEFIWPVGTEGLTVAGNALNATHRYIGGNATVVDVINRDERTIEMRGMFPGTNGWDLARALMEVLVMEYPPTGKLLNLPGIFPHQQFVYHTDYNFTRDETQIGDDSVTYSVSFIKTGNRGGGGSGRPGAAKVVPISTRPQAAESTTTSRRRVGALGGGGTSPAARPTPTTGQLVIRQSPANAPGFRYVVVSTGYRTLKQIAKVVYDDPDRYYTLFQTNTKVFEQLGWTMIKAATTPLPIGIQIFFD